MAKHHVNPNTGNSSVCKAAKGGCPFGGDTGEDNHYNSAEEASQAAEKLMAENYSTVNAAYRKKDTSALANMNREMKKRIIKEAVEGSNKLHPSVVAKAFSKDNDELIRRNVTQNFKSQKILREMAGDESAKVRLGVAKATNNPAVLASLASDEDAFVRRAVIVNKNTPVKARKVALSTNSPSPKTRDQRIRESVSGRGFRETRRMDSTGDLFLESSKITESDQIDMYSVANIYHAEESGGGDITIMSSGEGHPITIAHNNYSFTKDDKEELGFRESDTLKPFVDVSATKNSILQQPGIEVNGEKLYGESFRYSVNNGADLKKSFEVAQGHADSLTWDRLEMGMRIDHDLTSRPSTEYNDEGDISKMNLSHHFMQR